MSESSLSPMSACLGCFPMMLLVGRTLPLAQGLLGHWRGRSRPGPLPCCGPSEAAGSRGRGGVNPYTETVFFHPFPLQATRRLHVVHPFGELSDRPERPGPRTCSPCAQGRRHRQGPAGATRQSSASTGLQLGAWCAAFSCTAGRVCPTTTRVSLPLHSTITLEVSPSVVPNARPTPNPASTLYGLQPWPWPSQHLLHPPTRPRPSTT